MLDNVSMRIEPGAMGHTDRSLRLSQNHPDGLIGALRAGQEGSVNVLGQELRGASESAMSKVRRQKMGYIFQQHNLLDYLTVAQNVMMSLQLGTGRKLSRKDQRHRVEDILKQVGLEPAGWRLCAQLQGGRSSAQTLCPGPWSLTPALILADEPTASLDKESGRTVVELIPQCPLPRAGCQRGTGDPRQPHPRRGG